VRVARAWTKRRGRSSRDGAETVEVSGNAVAAHVTSFTWSAAPRRAPLGCPSMRMARSYSIVRAVWLRRSGCLPLACSLLKGAVGRQGRGGRGCAWVEGAVASRTAQHTCMVEYVLLRIHLRRWRKRRRAPQNPAASARHAERRGPCSEGGSERGGPAFQLNGGIEIVLKAASMGPSTLDHAQAAVSPFDWAPRNRRGGVRMSRS
jgi:hypothetical protein